MLEPHQITQASTPSLRPVQYVGYVVFALLMVVLASALYSGYGEFGSLWTVILTVVAGYLAADFASGIVHFLADNFGSPDTPFLGEGFVLPFRQHHADPLGITRNGFLVANGNNALVCLPVLIPVVLFLPITESRIGYLAGVFFFVMLFAVFFTNQAHKWAHMERVPAPVAFLQRTGLIISRSHHDIHHSSPFDTHYCITVGVWNPLFERIGFFPWLERFIRRWVPGTDPLPRVEREAREALLKAQGVAE
ncbi:MAG: fatty acid desaturase CarF family protein [Gemmatimonadota bacterium]